MTDHPDPVDQATDRPHQEPQRKGRHQQKHPGGNQQVDHRDHAKQHRDAETEHAEHNDRQNTGQDHEQRVENVHAGDHPRAPGLARLALDQRVQRHDVEPATDTNGHQVNDPAPAARDRQHLRDPRALQRLLRASQHQIEAEHGQAERTERDQADLDAAMRQPRAQHCSG